jgi:hypothetical protein
MSAKKHQAAALPEEGGGEDEAQRVQLRAQPAAAAAKGKQKQPSDTRLIGALLWPKLHRGGEMGRGRWQMVGMTLLAAARTVISHQMTLYNQRIAYNLQALNTAAFFSLMRRFLGLSLVQV